ncbi:MAG TPA: NAD(P)/FAD-dependent oxidoreductase [Myxococcota bacterium]|nr:NAD(P)/FAD-dependent oxidoreductase [Myxococcota bacterium]
MKPDIPAQVDVVVVGGGIGGLTAGALLSKAGMSVCVIEPELKPGGYLAGFERKRFQFDSAIHWLNQCGPGGFVHKVFGHIDRDHPSCPPLHRIRRVRCGELDYLLTDEPDQLREALCRDFPSSARGVHELFDKARVIGDRMARYAEFNRAFETRNIFGKAYAGMRLSFWGLPFIRVYKKTAVEGLSELGLEPDLAQLWCSELDFLSILVPLGWAYFGDYQAPPKGGSMAFPRWLVEQIRGNGGHVVLRRRVEEILLEDGLAVGVRTHEDEVVRCRYVLAACDLETVYERMLPAGTVPEPMLEKIRGADLYPSSVSVNLGLDCPVEELGFDEEFVFLTDAGHAREDYGKGDPQLAGLSVLAPSFRDRSLAPEGKGTLTIYCSATMDQDWKLGPGNERTAEYREAKKDYASVLIERVERTLAPGLRGHIELMDVATPITHWRYTHNRGGSIMAARPNKQNIKAGVAHYETPVPNMFLSGHWAEYGGGVPIAVKAASNASLLVLKAERHPGFAELARVMDSPDVRGSYRPGQKTLVAS